MADGHRSWLLAVNHGQWNTVTISCDASVSPDWVLLTINGTMYDNNGQGFGAGDDLDTIGRYQIAGQMESGVGAGIFLDDITIVDTAPAPSGPEFLGIRLASSDAFSFMTVDGPDYLLQSAKHPSKPFWRNTGVAVNGTGGAVAVTGPAGVAPSLIYRIVEK